ncbi:MAG: hypothetical protein IK066_04535 [Kiritimatiellae bacterium]|nr:hypothetical protein [Kiritimatiellia bacterium]
MTTETTTTTNPDTPRVFSAAELAKCRALLAEGAAKLVSKESGTWRKAAAQDGQTGWEYKAYVRLVRKWERISEGDRALCEEFLRRYASAGNQSEGLEVTDPKADRETYKGTWKMVRTALSVLRTDPAGQGVFQTLVWPAEFDGEFGEFCAESSPLHHEDAKAFANAPEPPSTHAHANVKGHIYRVNATVNPEDGTWQGQEVDDIARTPPLFGTWSRSADSWTLRIRGEHREWPLFQTPGATTAEELQELAEGFAAEEDSENSEGSEDSEVPAIQELDWAHAVMTSTADMDPYGMFSVSVEIVFPVATLVATVRVQKRQVEVSASYSNLAVPPTLADATAALPTTDAATYAALDDLADYFIVDGGAPRKNEFGLLDGTVTWRIPVQDSTVGNGGGLAGTWSRSAERLTLRIRGDYQVSPPFPVAGAASVAGILALAQPFRGSAPEGASPVWDRPVMTSSADMDAYGLFSVTAEIAWPVPQVARHAHAHDRYIDIDFSFSNRSAVPTAAELGGGGLSDALSAYAVLASGGVPRKNEFGLLDGSGTWRIPRTRLTGWIRVRNDGGENPVYRCRGWNLPGDAQRAGSASVPSAATCTVKVTVTLPVSGGRFEVDGEGYVSGTDVRLPAGTHTVSFPAVPGYVAPAAFQTQGGTYTRAYSAIPGSAGAPVEAFRIDAARGVWWPEAESEWADECDEGGFYRSGGVLYRFDGEDFVVVAESAAQAVDAQEGTYTVREAMKAGKIYRVDGVAPEFYRRRPGHVPRGGAVGQRLTFYSADALLLDNDDHAVGFLDGLDTWSISTDSEPEEPAPNTVYLGSNGAVVVGAADGQETVHWLVTANGAVAEAAIFEPVDVAGASASIGWVDFSHACEAGTCYVTRSGSWFCNGTTVAAVSPVECLWLDRETARFVDEEDAEDVEDCEADGHYLFDGTLWHWDGEAMVNVTEGAVRVAAVDTETARVAVTPEADCLYWDSNEGDLYARSASDTSSLVALDWVGATSVDAETGTYVCNGSSVTPTETCIVFAEATDEWYRIEVDGTTRTTTLLVSPVVLEAVSSESGGRILGWVDAELGEHYAVRRETDTAFYCCHLDGDNHAVLEEIEPEECQWLDARTGKWAAGYFFESAAVAGTFYAWNGSVWYFDGTAFGERNEAERAEAVQLGTAENPVLVASADTANGTVVLWGDETQTAVAAVAGTVYLDVSGAGLGTYYRHDGTALAAWTPTASAVVEAGGGGGAGEGWFGAGSDGSMYFLTVPFPVAWRWRPDEYCCTTSVQLEFNDFGLVDAVWTVELEKNPWWGNGNGVTFVCDRDFPRSVLYAHEYTQYRNGAGYQTGNWVDEHGNNVSTASEAETASGTVQTKKYKLVTTTGTVTIKAFSTLSRAAAAANIAARAQANPDLYHYKVHSDLSRHGHWWVVTLHEDRREKVEYTLTVTTK